VEFARKQVSPVTLLEIQYLLESDRLRDLGEGWVDAIRGDDRWDIDSADLLSLCTTAVAVTWTRDPFDRLLVAHAPLRRWRIAL
jgi:PIN domain nuclease of toxin-antitoxin system